MKHKWLFIIPILFFILPLTIPIEAADADWQQSTFYVNSFNHYTEEWSTVGSEPWIDNSASYIYHSIPLEHIGWFEFPDLGSDRHPVNMTLQLYAKTDQSGYNLRCYYKFQASNATSGWQMMGATLTTTFKWHNTTITSLNSTADFNNFRIFLMRLDGGPGPAVTVQKARVVVWHSKATYYIFHGLLNEDTGLYVGPVYVTAFVQGYAPETFEVDGTTIQGFGDRPDYFVFLLGSTTREFHPHTDGRDDEADIYIFNGSLMLYYDITYYDAGNVLSIYPYASVERKINGTWMVVEQHKLDATRTTRFALSYGRHYQFAVKDHEEYIIGTVQAKTDSTIELTINPLAFPQDPYMLVHYYVLCSARREGSNVIISYSDELSQTSLVTIYIRYLNWTEANTYSKSSNAFSYTWTEADNETNYLVDVVVDHGRYGAFTFPFALEKSYGPNPFSLSILGSPININLNLLAPAFMLLAVAGAFSSLNIDAGIVAVCLVFALFCAIGWLDFGTLTSPIIITALTLALIVAISHARRKGGYFFR